MVVRCHSKAYGLPAPLLEGGQVQRSPPRLVVAVAAARAPRLPPTLQRAVGDVVPVEGGHGLNPAGDVTFCLSMALMS